MWTCRQEGQSRHKRNTNVDDKRKCLQEEISYLQGESGWRHAALTDRMISAKNFYFSLQRDCVQWNMKTIDCHDFWVRRRGESPRTSLHCVAINSEIIYLTFLLLFFVLLLTGYSCGWTYHLYTSEHSANDDETTTLRYISVKIIKCESAVKTWRLSRE